MRQVDEADAADEAGMRHADEADEADMRQARGRQMRQTFDHAASQLQTFDVSVADVRADEAGRRQADEAGRRQADEADEADEAGTRQTRQRVQVGFGIRTCRQMISQRLAPPSVTPPP